MVGIAAAAGAAHTGVRSRRPPAGRNGDSPGRLATLRSSARDRRGVRGFHRRSGREGGARRALDRTRIGTTYRYAPRADFDRYRIARQRERRQRVEPGHRGVRRPNGGRIAVILGARASRPPFSLFLQRKRGGRDARVPRTIHRSAAGPAAGPPAARWRLSLAAEPAAVQPASRRRYGRSNSKLDICSRHNRCSLFSWRNQPMADEKKVTETTTKTKSDAFGSPRERDTVTKETKSKGGIFGDRKETTTTTERKEDE